MRTVTPKGGVQYRLDGNMVVQQMEVGIFASISLREITSPEVLRSSIQAVLLSNALKEDFADDEFLPLLEKEYANRISLARNKFIVVSGFLFEGHPPAEHIQHAGVNVRFLNEAKNAQDADLIENHIKCVEELAFRPFKEPRPEGSMFVAVEVTADSPSTAEAKARQSLDFIRGLLNFVFNETKLGEFRIFGNITPRPINEIPSTPYRTVHKTSGQVATETAWFDRYWMQPKKLLSFGNGNEVRAVNFSRHLAHLSKGHGLSTAVERAMLIYCRALDKHDWRASYLELWTALEALLLSSTQDNHVNIPQRLSRMYKDKYFVLAKSHQLREMRNLFTHEIFELEESDTKMLLNELNRFVCDTLRFASVNAMKFESLRQWHEFLDVPQDTAEIQRRLSLYESVLKFREVSREPTPPHNS